MNTSIIICTFNRSGLLDKTLERLRCLDVSVCADWEILVVNNNSTDDTDAVIRRHSEHLPIRRLWEPRTGKSHAANLAISEAKGDLLLWTDDDVLVDRDWLKAYVQTANASRGQFLRRADRTLVRVRAAGMDQDPSSCGSPHVSPSAMGSHNP